MGTLTEQRTSSALLPGVKLTTIQRGGLTTETPWTVNLSVVRTAQAAEKTLSDLKAAGFQGRLDAVQTQGVVTGELGYMVRVGRYATRAQAETVQAALKARGFSGGVQDTPEDGGPSSGP